MRDFFVGWEKIGHVGQFLTDFLLQALCKLAELTDLTLQCMRPTGIKHCSSIVQSGSPASLPAMLLHNQYFCSNTSANL